MCVFEDGSESQVRAVIRTLGRWRTAMVAEDKTNNYSKAGDGEYLEYYRHCAIYWPSSRTVRKGPRLPSHVHCLARRRQASDMFALVARIWSQFIISTGNNLLSSLASLEFEQFASLTEHSPGLGIFSYLLATLSCPLFLLLNNRICFPALNLRHCWLEFFLFTTGR